MKAVQFTTTKGGIENNLKINASAAVPKATKPDQHIIKVIATALNPVDWKPAEVGFIDRYMIKKPATPCIDFAGVLVTPAASSTLKPGQLVFGMAGLSIFAGGALAEYAIAEDKAVAALPQGLDPKSAATIGVAGITAYQAILEYATPGDRIFINGGSGGVGCFGIQMAKVKDIHVTTSCSTHNVDFCKSIGADHVIDYKQGDVVEQLQALVKTTGKKFDIIVDNVGSDFDIYWKAHTYTNSGAPYVFVAGKPSLSMVWNMVKITSIPGFLGGGKRKLHTIMAKPSTTQSAEIAQWMKEGKVKPVVDSTFSMEDASKAFERSKSGRAVGKIVVDIAPNSA